MIKYIDLFSGASGLSFYFNKNKQYKHIASVEWEKWPLESSKKYFKGTSNNYINFDVSRVDELLHGFQDPKFGSHPGLKSLTQEVDLVIGGPPCQAYSVANRNHYKDKHDDPKNVLFESYLDVAKKMNAKFFIFENVQGLLTAKIKNKNIIDLVIKDAKKKGYILDKDVKKSLLDFSQFGIPQKRRRLILLGVRKDIYLKNKNIFSDFRNLLDDAKVNWTHNVQDALSDLGTFRRYNGKYLKNNDGIYPQLHMPRFHNKRDINIFKEAVKLSLKNKFNNIESSNLYLKYHGKNSLVHKYHVLSMGKPSTTILAHLCKDGNRFILEDTKQSRTITPREAARLQTFPDKFEFLGGQSNAFRMIGNAVPPKFSRILSKIILEVINGI